MVSIPIETPLLSCPEVWVLAFFSILGPDLSIHWLLDVVLKTNDTNDDNDDTDDDDDDNHENNGNRNNDGDTTNVVGKPPPHLSDGVHDVIGIELIFKARCRGVIRRGAGWRFPKDPHLSAIAPPKRQIAIQDYR